MTRLGLITFGILFAVMATRGAAAPIRYDVQLSTTAPSGPPPHPVFANATIALTYTWDAAPLTPIANAPGVGTAWITTWPSTNTVAMVEVNGTGQIDGLYSAQIASTSWWSFLDNGIGSDAVRFPAVSINVNGSTVEIRSLEAFFSNSTITGGATISPFPFDSADAWDSGAIITLNPSSRGGGTVVDGSATVVPEPSAAAISISAVLSLAAIRRRK